MARRATSGRRSPIDSLDRKEARTWANLYRLAQANPDQRHCLNPDAPYEERAYVRANDVDFLISMLEYFAENGTFNIEYPNIERMLLHMRLKTLRAAGNSREVAIEMLAHEEHCSVSTIERTLR